VGEWPTLPANAQGACYFIFVSVYPQPDDADPAESRCDYFQAPVYVFEFGKQRGDRAFPDWPDVTVGTVGRTVDQVRLTFDGACATQTYEMTGPLLRDNPSRRVFILDERDRCRWKTAEGIADGVIVTTVEKPAPYRD